MSFSSAPHTSQYPPKIRGQRPNLDRKRSRWHGLSATQQRAGAAAIVLIGTLQAPWYTRTTTQLAASSSEAANTLAQTKQDLSGFEAFSLVEAAVLLVAVAVISLIWARATKKQFSLPLRDGTVVAAAATWICFLVVYRIFDRTDSGTVSDVTMVTAIQWGIFVTLAGSLLLLVTGIDLRNTERRIREQTRAETDRDSDFEPNYIDAHDAPTQIYDRLR